MGRVRDRGSGRGAPADQVRAPSRVLDVRAWLAIEAGLELDAGRGEARRDLGREEVAVEIDGVSEELVEVALPM
jgi:hypothetical protein